MRRKISQIIQNYSTRVYFDSFNMRRKLLVPRGQNHAHFEAWIQLDTVETGYYAHGMCG